MLNITDSNTTIGPLSQSSNLKNGLLGIIIEIFCLWMFLGNLLILIVLKLYRPWSIPDVLVFSLALSDLLNVIFPVQLLTVIPNILGISWSKEICAIYIWATYWFRMASVLTVSVISIDRLLSITKPFLYRSKVIHEVGKLKILMLVLWLIACIVAVLPFVDLGIGKTGYRNGECHYQLLDLAPKGYAYGYLVEAIGLIQLVVVLYCYIVIKMTTSDFLRRQEKFTSSETTSALGKALQQMHSPSNSLQKKGLTVMTLSPQPSTDDNANKQDRRTDTIAISGKTRLKKVLSEASLRGSINSRSSSKRGSTKTRKTDGMKQVVNVEKMMAVLVFLFYISWLPFLMSNFYSLFTNKQNDRVIIIVGFCSLINGLINPIIYGTLNPRYKKGYLFVLRKIFTICGGKQPDMTLADFDARKRKSFKTLRNMQQMREATVSVRSTSSTMTYRHSVDTQNDSLSISISSENTETSSIHEGGMPARDGSIVSPRTKAVHFDTLMEEIDAELEHRSRRNSVVDTNDYKETGCPVLNFHEFVPVRNGFLRQFSNVSDNDDVVFIDDSPRSLRSLISKKGSSEKDNADNTVDDSENKNIKTVTFLNFHNKLFVHDGHVNEGFQSETAEIEDTHL